MRLTANLLSQHGFMRVGRKFTYLRLLSYGWRTLTDRGAQVFAAADGDSARRYAACEGLRFPRESVIKIIAARRQGALQL